MTKTIMILAIAAVFVIGTIVASTDVFAASKLTICHKPGTIDEKTIQIKDKALSAHLAHDDTEGACPDDGGGNNGGNGGVSPETESQIDDIQDKINDPLFGLFEIKAEIIDLLTAVGLIQAETDKIQMIKDDVETIKAQSDIILKIKDLAEEITEQTDKIQMIKDDVEDIKSETTLQIKRIKFDSEEVGARVIHCNSDKDFKVFGNLLMEPGAHVQINPTTSFLADNIRNESPFKTSMFYMVNGFAGEILAVSLQFSSPEAASGFVNMETHADAIADCFERFPDT